MEWTISEIEYNYDSNSIKIEPKNFNNEPIEIKRIKKTEVKKIKGTEAEVEASIAAIKEVELHVEN